jgi:small subunit ribosomal protein S27Ae
LSQKLFVMQIFIGTTSYEVDSATSVESLKAMIENKEFVPADQIRLSFGSKILEFGSLERNGVSEEDELALGLEVQAGMRRKWRKKRMRRLRRKRRKMRQRAR